MKVKFVSIAAFWGILSEIILEEKKNMKLLTITTTISILIAFTLFTSGCGEREPPLENNCLEIEAVKASKETVEPEEQVDIETIAKDEDGNELTYKYEAGDGTITGTGSKVEWKAPNKIGKYSITVIVSNGECSASKSTMITVHKLYDFESGTEEWWPQTHPCCLAMYKVEWATDPVNQDNHVLKVSSNFDPDKRGKDKGGLGDGEVVKDLASPANFQGATLKCKVYATTGARGRGDAPNGFQILLKDKNWNNYYSKWVNIPQENRWFEVTAIPLEGDVVDPDFDITSVIMVGVKMGLNDKATKPFKGGIYIDDFHVRP